ncbi:MAG: UDP-glucose 4-epimerase GalE [Bacteroidota bacterium]|jgi:UDP-glucose 4-epimerase
MARILLTGSTGYIGSHTAVALLEAGHELVGLDNYSRSLAGVSQRIQEITGKTYTQHRVDLVDAAALNKALELESAIDAVIHFAAFKAVGESSSNPLRYFRNNLGGQINLMEACDQFGIRNLVFSSSCTVYGNPQVIPVTEGSPLLEPESPYGRTKAVGEAMLRDWVKSNLPQGGNARQVIALRYFNPVGAHPSARIGECTVGVPDNLIPYITQTAMGKREQLTVFGNDYPTRDGTCLRDYIHVCDIAAAHVDAVNRLLGQNSSSSPWTVYNLGTGIGQTVLEMIQAFESVNQMNLPWSYGPRRPGDVVAVYADNRKAVDELGWQIRYSLQDMMRTAWDWEQMQANDPL